MIISLVGPNLYAKQRELRSLVGSTPTIRVFGEEGLSKWYEVLGQSDLFGQSSSLLGERVLEDLAKADQDRLAEHLKAQRADESDQNVIFVIADEKQLQKGALGAYLTEQKVQHFPQPSAAKIGLWVQQEAERLGVTIAKHLIPKLVAKLGADQFALYTELERWSLHQPAEITEQAIESMVALESDIDTFGLTTAWEQKKTSSALVTLGELRRQGVADQMIMGMLGWKVEALLLQAGKRSKLTKWTAAELEAAMIGLYNLDLGIKQGKIEQEVGLELWLIETTAQ